jgi:hypothetical protein
MSSYKLQLMVVQEVRGDRGGTEPTGEYTLSFETETGLLVYNRITSAVKRVESVSDGMS